MLGRGRGQPGKWLREDAAGGSFDLAPGALVCGRPAFQRCGRCEQPAGHRWAWVPGLAKGVWKGINSTHCLARGLSNRHQQPQLAGLLINRYPWAG